MRTFDERELWKAQRTLSTLVRSPDHRRSAGFASQEDLFNAAQIDGRTARRALAGLDFSSEYYRKLIRAIDPDCDVKATLAMLSAKESSDRIARISINRILSVNMRDLATWRRYVFDLFQMHCLPVPTRGVEVQRIIGELLAKPRINGDFISAAIFSMSILMWLINENIVYSDQNEKASLITIVLVQLARAAGQVEHLSLHKRAIKIGEMLLTEYPENAPLRRLVMDSRAQFLTNFSNSRKSLKMALSMHEEERRYAKEIINNFGAGFNSRDELYVCVESFYNYLSLAERLIGIEFVTKYISEYEELLKYAESLSANEQVYELSDISSETILMARIMKAKVFHFRNKRDEVEIIYNNLLASQNSVEMNKKIRNNMLPLLS